MKEKWKIIKIRKKDKNKKERERKEKERKIIKEKEKKYDCDTRNFVWFLFGNEL